MLLWPVALALKEIFLYSLLFCQVLEIRFEMRLSEKKYTYGVLLIFLSAKVRLNIEKLEAVDKQKKKNQEEKGKSHIDLLL